MFVRNNGSPTVIIALSVSTLLKTLIPHEILTSLPQDVCLADDCQEEREDKWYCLQRTSLDSVVVISNVANFMARSDQNPSSGSDDGSPPLAIEGAYSDDYDDSDD